MTHFARYDDEGRIVATGYVPESMLDLQVGNIHVGLVDGETHFIQDKKPTPRPPQATILAGKALAYLPTPCVITINGKSYPCSDSFAELEFDHPGRYRLVVSAFPYLDAHFTVDA